MPPRIIPTGFSTTLLWQSYSSSAFICRKLTPLLRYTHFVSSFVPNKIYRLIINRCLRWPCEIYSFIFSAFETTVLRVRRLYFVFNCPLLTDQLFVFIGRIFRQPQGSENLHKILECCKHRKTGMLIKTCRHIFGLRKNDATLSQNQNTVRNLQYLLRT